MSRLRRRRALARHLRLTVAATAAHRAAAGGLAARAGALGARGQQCKCCGETAQEAERSVFDGGHTTSGGEKRGEREVRRASIPGWLDR